jgi:hypothetical protein
MVAGAAMAGAAVVVTGHTDGARAERWAGAVVGALLAFGSRADAKAVGANRGKLVSADLKGPPTGAVQSGPWVLNRGLHGLCS